MDVEADRSAPPPGRTSVDQDSPSRIPPSRIGTIPTDRMGSARGSSPPVSRSSAQYVTESQGGEGQSTLAC